MIIGLDAGHCLRGADTGAQGCGMREEVMTRNVVNQVSRRLQAAGHTVVICNVETAPSIRDSLSARYTKANQAGVDIFISVHINSGGGTGSEIFTYAARRLPVAVKILDNLHALGYQNRGIKDALNYDGRGHSLAVVRNTHAPAMLVECCFIDSQADINKYKQLGATKIGDAIADGILGQATPHPGTPKPAPAQPAAKANKPSGQETSWRNLDGKTGICTGNGVRIRSSKSTANLDNVIGSLNKGDRMSLYRQEGDWIHIYCKPHGGYVHKNYVNIL